jgi:hypothetical protein
MSEVVKLNNKKHISLYEISDSQDIAIWGGEDPVSALGWYRSAPTDSKIWVSGWLADEEDAKLISEPVEITPIVLATIADCMERWAK